MLDPEEGDPPQGVHWYCTTCTISITSLIKVHKSKKDTATQFANKGSLADYIKTKVPICEDYRHGICAHGMSGRKLVDGNKCAFRHPKKCTRFCQFGNDPQYGCTYCYAECHFMHPIICRYSARHNHCQDEKCTYAHLKGTKRGKKSSNRAGPKHEAHPRHEEQRGPPSGPRGPPAPKGYQRMDPSKLGFSSYSDQFTKNAPNIQVNKKNNSPHGNQEEFYYRQSDFPVHDPSYSESDGYYKQNDPSQTPSNLPDQQSFLDLCKLVKTMTIPSQNFKLDSKQSSNR